MGEDRAPREVIVLPWEWAPSTAWSNENRERRVGLSDYFDYAINRDYL